MSNFREFIRGRFTIFGVIVGLCVFPAWLRSASEIPDWLASSLETNTDFDDAEAIVLEHYHRESISSKARTDLHTRYAIKIADRNARDFAIADIPIEDDIRALKQFRAWIVFPNGRVESFGKKDLIIVADRLDDLYSESKRCVLDRTASIRPGTVFAYEYNISRETHFLSTVWVFQSVFPTIRSRFELDIPHNWTAVPYFLNGDSIPVQHKKGIQYWEARNLPGIKEEPYQPPLGQLLFRMAINLQAPDPELKKFGYKSFSSWTDVARFTAEMHQASLMDLDSSIAAKSLELTESTETKWEKIQAIAAFVQSINYVSTSMDLSKGGGHQPRHPNDVLSQHWGDCKDMAALTRALLVEAGVDSAPVLARVGKDDYVPEEWPSPFMFNHCIVGIPFDESPESVHILEDTPLGPILLFDPTQRYTPVGHLPRSLTGTHILIGSEGVDKLVTVPSPKPDSWHVERTLDATILANGDLQAKLTETGCGAAGDFLRSVAMTSSEEELKKFLQRWISSSTRLADIQHIEHIDGWDRGEFTLVVDFTATRFAKAVGTDHFAFSPVFLTQLDWVPPAREERETDLVTEALSLSESLHYTFVEGLTIENLPGTVRIHGEYGNYALSASLNENGFSIAREYEVFCQSIPPNQYPEFVEYFETISRTDTEQVVLSRIGQGSGE